LINTQLKLENYNQLFKYYENLTEDSKKIFINNLEDARKGLEHSQLRNLSRSFSEGTDRYAALNEIRCSSETDSLINLFLSKNDFNELPLSPYYEVFNMAVENNINIITFLKKLNTSPLQGLIKQLTDSSESCSQYFTMYLNSERIRENDYHGSRVYVAVAKVILLSALEDAKNNSIALADVFNGIFREYVQNGINLVKYLYRNEYMRLVYKTLDNAEHKFFILMHLANDARERTNTSSMLRYIKEAIDAYPYWAELIKEYDRELFN
jgi:hypothetical protein